MKGLKELLPIFLVTSNFIHKLVTLFKISRKWDADKDKNALHDSKPFRVFILKKEIKYARFSINRFLLLMIDKKFLYLPI